MEVRRITEKEEGEALQVKRRCSLKKRGKCVTKFSRCGKGGLITCHIAGVR
jgi:hypothetical protein